MCILLMLDHAKFRVSNFFFPNVIEEKPLAGRLETPPPPPPGKGRVKFLQWWIQKLRSGEASKILFQRKNLINGCLSPLFWKNK